MRSVLGRRFVTIALASSLLFSVLPAASAQAVTSSAIRTALETKINASRTLRGLRPLRLTTTLMKCDAASPSGTSCMQYWSGDHAKRLAARGYLYHDTSDRLWNEVPRSAWWRAENVGYMTNRIAVADAIHKAFMASPGHRENILERRATHMAIGVYQSGGKIWVTERFADLTR